MTTQLARNFTLEEFARVSSGGEIPSELIRSGTVAAVAQLLQELRDLVPNVLAVIPTSYHRTPDHNRRIGGAPTSEHLEGRAVDAMFVGATDRELVRSVMEARARGRAITFGQLVVYDTTGHAHVSLPRSDGRPNGQILRKKADGSYVPVTDWRDLPDSRRALHCCPGCRGALPHGTSHP